MTTKARIEKYLSRQKKHHEAQVKRLRTFGNPPLTEIAQHREDLEVLAALSEMTQKNIKEEAPAPTTTSDDSARAKYGAATKP